MPKPVYLNYGDPLPDNPKAYIVRIHSNDDKNVEEGLEFEDNGRKVIDVYEISAPSLIERLSQDPNVRAIYVVKPKQ